MEINQIERLTSFIINNETLMTATIVSSIGFLGVFFTARYSVKTAIASKEKQHQMDVDLENRKNKLELYQKWIEIMKLIFKEGNSKKLESKTVDFYQESMFYASKDTILAILSFKNSANNINGNIGDTLFKVENILIQMRNDLNLSNKGLKKGDLIKIIIVDPREVDIMLKNQKIATRFKNYVLTLIKIIKKDK